MILRRIIKIVATRRHILKLKCTKFDFGWGSAPNSAGGAHNAPPDTLARLRVLLLREMEGGKEGEKRENVRGSRGRGPFGVGRREIRE